MPPVGTRCHELRVNDSSGQWRLMYRIDRDAILILDVFQKKTPRTPQTAIAACQQRAKEYDSAAK
jgi:phage-related protein